MNKIQPNKVQRIVCPKCGELQVKIYPWSSIKAQGTGVIPNCGKCIQNQTKHLKIS